MQLAERELWKPRRDEVEGTHDFSMSLVEGSVASYFPPLQLSHLVLYKRRRHELGEYYGDDEYGAAFLNGPTGWVEILAGHFEAVELPAGPHPDEEACTVGDFLDGAAIAAVAMSDLRNRHGAESTGTFVRWLSAKARPIGRRGNAQGITKVGAI